MRLVLDTPITTPAITKLEVEPGLVQLNIETGEVSGAFLRGLTDQDQAERSLPATATLPAEALQALRTALLQSQGRPGRIEAASPGSVEPNGGNGR
jgi:hypothetical protein